MATQAKLAEREGLVEAIRREASKKVTVVHHLETALSTALSTRQTQAAELDSTLGTLSAEAEAKKEVEHQLLAVSGYVYEQDQAIGELRMEAAAKAGVETALEVVRGELAQQQCTIGELRMQVRARQQEPTVRDWGVESHERGKESHVSARRVCSRTLTRGMLCCMRVQVEGLSGELAAARAQLSEREAEALAERDAFRAVEMKLEEVQAAYGEALKRNAVTEASSEAAAQLAEATAALQAQGNQLQTLRTEICEREAEMQGLNSSIDALKQHVLEQAEVNEELEAQVEAAKRLQGERERRIRQLKEEAVSYAQLEETLRMQVRCFAHGPTAPLTLTASSGR